MEHRIRIHLDGFFDPLEGYLVPEDSRSKIESIFGTERPGVARADGTRLVVNHEEQYSRDREDKSFEDPLLGYTVSFEDPLVGRRLEELFREKREVKVSISSDGREMKIGY